MVVRRAGKTMAPVRSQAMDRRDSRSVARAPQILTCHFRRGNGSLAIINCFSIFASTSLIFIAVKKSGGCAPLSRGGGENVCRWPSVHEKLTQCWLHVGPPSSTLVQHEASAWLPSCFQGVVFKGYRHTAGWVVGQCARPHNKSWAVTGGWG